MEWILPILLICISLMIYFYNLKKKNNSSGNFINESNLELFNMERNLVKNELKRVGYFSSLSLNFYDSRDSLINVCNKYDLDLDTIINELE